MELKLFFKLVIFTVAVFPTFVISDDLITDTDGKIYWKNTWQVRPKRGSKIIDEHNVVLNGYVKVKKLNAVERKKAMAARKRFLESMESMSDNLQKSKARVGNNITKNVLKSVNHGMANMDSNMYKIGPVNMLEPNQIMNQGRDSGARNKKKNQNKKSAKKGNKHNDSDEYSDENSEEDININSKGKNNVIEENAKVYTNNENNNARVIIGDNSGNINNSNNVYSSNNFDSGIGMNNKNRKGIVPPSDVYDKNNGKVQNNFNGDSSNVNKKNLKGSAKKKPINRKNANTRNNINSGNKNMNNSSSINSDNNNEIGNVVGSKITF